MNAISTESRPYTSVMNSTRVNMSQSRRRVCFFPNFSLSVFTLSCVLLGFVSHVHAWDSADFELFDLVEEVPLSFYDVLGVEKVSLQFEVLLRGRLSLTVVHFADPVFWCCNLSCIGVFIGPHQIGVVF